MHYVHAHWVRHDGAQFTTYHETMRNQIGTHDTQHAEQKLREAFPNPHENARWYLMALEIHPNKP